MRYLRRFNLQNRDFDIYVAEDLYSDIRTRVLVRDNWKCVKCGESKKRLNVHHIDRSGQPDYYNKMNNKIDNLMTLCGRCHVKIHHD
jgi:5-methylcytosine-specific restriction endonuclease McrA